MVIIPCFYWSGKMVIIPLIIPSKNMVSFLSHDGLPGYPQSSSMQKSAMFHEINHPAIGDPHGELDPPIWWFSIMSTFTRGVLVKPHVWQARKARKAPMLGATAPPARPVLKLMTSCWWDLWTPAARPETLSGPGVAKSLGWVWITF